MPLRYLWPRYWATQPPTVREARIVGRHPLARWLFAVAAAAGITLIAAGPAATSTLLDDNLPGVVLYFWGVNLSVGGALALAGSLWRGRDVTALGVEAAGHISLAGATLVYALVIATVRLDGAAYAAGVDLAFAIGALARVVDIGRTLRAAHPHTLGAG